MAINLTTHQLQWLDCQYRELQNPWLSLHKLSVQAAVVAVARNGKPVKSSQMQSRSKSVDVCDGQVQFSIIRGRLQNHNQEVRPEDSE